MLSACRAYTPSQNHLENPTGNPKRQLCSAALRDAPEWNSSIATIVALNVDDSLVLVLPVLTVELTPLQNRLLAVLEPLMPSLPVPLGLACLQGRRSPRVDRAGHAGEASAPSHPPVDTPDRGA